MSLSIFVSKKRFRGYFFLLFSFYPVLGLSYLFFWSSPKDFYWRAWEYFDEIAYKNHCPSFWKGKEKGDQSRDYIFSYQKDWETEVSCDYEGFRVTPLPSESYPILVVGDSHTWGSGLSDFETIPWILADRLHIPVFNGGRTFNAFPSILLNLRVKKAKIIIELVAEHLINKKVFSERFECKEPSSYACKEKGHRFEVHPKRYLLPWKILRHLNFLSLFREATKNQLNDFMIRKNKIVQLDIDESDAAEAALNIFRRSETLKSLGYEYVFGVIPNRKFILSSNKDPRSIKAQTSFYQELRKRGVRFVDIQRQFSQEEVSSLYFPTDTHINAKGASIIAEAIRVILEQDLNSILYSLTFSPS